MAYLTDRKRAVGMGSAKTGTENFWRMTVSSYGLLILTPLFLCTFGSQLGQPYEEVLAHFARPYPAVITALMLVAGFLHFIRGMRMVIEDYSHGMTREWLIIAVTCLSYFAMGMGVFALVRLAL
ncbi:MULTISPECIES: succinate dehydrogenase, hydrophobic membrane anchor protein [unclassified Meridianimarinicoccus]|uniref:succinate dehydrogenase, hydrophobic membrane anchor protein n=1 Tax=unclassified Meridianimarinicoccus TaxID=2923344 RepID=UPI001867E49F|nr:succinate dehydrogenase, hydrophobic membrane anchor protein [Fluviibacterium sp. MJW13]